MRRLPPEAQDHPVWRRVRAFLETWVDPESALFLAVDNAWLEFDIATAQEGTAISPRLPSVFHGYGSRETIRLKGLSVEQQMPATHQALEILTGRAIDPAVLGRVRSCFELLPPGADVFQVGAMIARKTDAFRMCIRGLELAEILPCLERLGWGGERDRLERLLDGLDGRISQLSLDLDVAETIRPKLGIACYLDPDGWPPRDRWEHFLTFLMREGLAAQPKGEALLTYPGHLDQRLQGDRWPSALRWSDAWRG